MVGLLAFSSKAQNAYQLIQSSPDHTIMAAAVDAAGLDLILQGTGPFTVFAPTDDAFNALPENMVDALLLDPEGVLRDILLYHLVSGENTSDGLSDGQSLVTLFGGQNLTVGIDGATVTINGAVVSGPDVDASNGVVHVLDAVLIPETTTVYDVVVDSEDHNTLEAALNAAGLDATLDGPGGFTLFAPTDAAFDALPDNLVNALLTDPEGVLSDILLHHVVGSIALSSGLTDGQAIETLFGQDVIVSTTGGVFINDAQVTVADIPTINGVVHVIDAVLIPETTTIFDIVENSEDHNTLETALIAAELDGTLDGAGAFTLFAPTDAAFDALPQGVLDILLSDPTGALANVLLYHVVGSIALSTDLVEGDLETLLAGENVSVSLDGGVFINGAEVTGADIVTVNGVVHVIDAVLVPAGTICTDFAEGPYTNFNTQFGGAPQAEFGICPVNQITGFEIWASESYTIDNFVAGQEYTFSVCDGPGAGTWDVELTVFDPEGGLVAIEQDCDITFTAPVDGTYIIGIQEVGFCGDESTNQATNNGFPTLSCTTANTVYTIIANSDDHNTLEAALIAAELAGVLADEGSEFTVFAPTDDAFAALDADLLEALLTDPTNLLADILLYHVAPGTALAGDLSDGQVITTVNGQDVTITIDGEMVMVNGVLVSVADLTADNGVVHVIDAVLLPEVMTTVYDIVVDSDIHNTLETAVNTAGLEGALSGEAGFITLFAPTDEAFDNLPDGLLDALLADPDGDLTEVLLYHVVEGINLSANLTEGAVPTLFGEDVTISLDGGVFVNDAEVIVADLVGINGVVHVIDVVLVPTSLNVDEVSAIESFSVYPNPANDIISVDMQMASSERITIDFVNMLGQVVKSVDLGQRSIGLNREQIDIDNMSDGFYLMNITIGQDQLTHKIQVVR